jgi:hypothetical protein
MTPPSIWLPLHHRLAFLWLRGKSKKTAQEKGGEVGGENVKIAVIIRSRMSGPDFQCAFEHNNYLSTRYRRLLFGAIVFLTLI